PSRQLDDLGRHERLGLEHVPHRLDCRVLHVRRRHIVHDDAGDDARAQRYDNPRADYRARQVAGNAICKKTERWDWDCYVNIQSKKLEVRSKKLELKDDRGGHGFGFTSKFLLLTSYF